MKRGRNEKKKMYISKRNLSDETVLDRGCTILCVTLCVTPLCCMTTSSTELCCSADVPINICTVFVFACLQQSVASLPSSRERWFFELLHGKKYIVDQIFIMAMQDVINKMKGTALGVAEYLTPVLKVVYTPVDKREWKVPVLYYL